MDARSLGPGELSLRLEPRSLGLVALGRGGAGPRDHFARPPVHLVGRAGRLLACRARLVGVTLRALERNLCLRAAGLLAFGLGLRGLRGGEREYKRPLGLGLLAARRRDLGARPPRRRLRLLGLRLRQRQRLRRPRLRQQSACARLGLAAPRRLRLASSRFLRPLRLRLERRDRHDDVVTASPDLVSGLASECDEDARDVALRVGELAGGNLRHREGAHVDGTVDLAESPVRDVDRQPERFFDLVAGEGRGRLSVDDDLGRRAALAHVDAGDSVAGGRRTRGANIVDRGGEQQRCHPHRLARCMSSHRSRPSLCFSRGFRSHSSGASGCR